MMEYQPTSLLHCYTVPECPECAELSDDATKTPSSSSGDTIHRPPPTPTPTLGSYHPPDGGAPQLGYFLPLSQIYCKSPRLRKR